MKIGWRVLSAACLLAIGAYACTASLGRLEASSLNAADTDYNLLVRGFRAGQLSLKKEAPPGLAQLADPYDPAANGVYQDFAYRARDMSYYKGRLYIYFGVTPILLLFWPFVALTGHYLFDRQAVTLFCVIGVLAGIGLLRALWRRYFSEVSAGVVAACALALGLAAGVPTMLPRSEVQEVATSCGYMLTMLALCAVWCALHEPERRWRWLAVASLTFGLALGARPNLLFGAAILLVPVMQASRERRPIPALLMAAMGPVVLIGLGLMLYNLLRFDSPFEFGTHYELGPKRLVTHQFFSPRYLWFNLQVCYLKPARWTGRFPFVHDIALPPLPTGYVGVEAPFGILTNIPLVWLVLAAPLAWRGRPDQERDTLRWFVTTVALLFAVCAIVVGFYCSASIRYEVDYLPALMLLAVIGILGLERLLANHVVWRRAARWGWGVLLGFSVAFNVLLSVVNYAHTACGLATVLAVRGRVPEAIQVFENALRIEPDFADGHLNLGIALWQAGKETEAIREYGYALWLKPDYADAHVNLGSALARLGRTDDAIRHYQEALRIKPDSPMAHHNLGYALYQEGRLQEAIKEFEAALRIWPDYPEAHNGLATVFAQTDRLPEAISHYQLALRLKPDDAEAHCNLGAALGQIGNMPEAITQFEQALRINPDYAGAHCNLATALAQTGKIPEAVVQFEQALQIKPDDSTIQINFAWLLATHAPSEGGDPIRAVSLAEHACGLTTNSVSAYLDTLAAAYAAAGRFNDAVTTAQKAIELAGATTRPQAAQEIASRLRLYRDGRVYRQSMDTPPAKNQ